MGADAGIEPASLPSEDSALSVGRIGPASHCGMRIADCGMKKSIGNPKSAIRNRSGARGVNRTRLISFRRRAPDPISHAGTDSILVDNRGIEPRLLGCRPSVLPLSLVAQTFGAPGASRTHTTGASNRRYTVGATGAQTKKGHPTFARVAFFTAFSLWPLPSRHLSASAYFVRRPRRIGLLWQRSHIHHITESPSVH